MENPTPIQEVPLAVSNIKQEVKVEHIDDSPTIPTPAHNFAKAAPLAYNQANLNKMLFDYLAEKLLMPTMNIPPPTRWPVLMPDLLTLRALAQLKPENFSFPKTNTFVNPFSKAAPIPKKNERKTSDNKSASTAESSSVCDQMIVKKEEPTEHKTCNCGANHGNQDKNGKKEKEKKVPKKKAQNRIKNIPGLVMQRVRSSIKGYFTLSPKLEKQEKRLVYVDKVLSTLNKSDKEKLLTFLEGYQKNWKTWNTIQNFLQTNPKYGGILLDVVLGFFGQDGLEDFNDWLTSGKMGEKSKAAVTEMKDRIGTKFSKILLKSEDHPAESAAMEEEKDGEEEVADLPSKIVKKEEN
jgi:hypothetical protein